MCVQLLIGRLCPFYNKKGPETPENKQIKATDQPCSGGLRYRGILTRKKLANVRTCSESSRKRKKH